MERQDDVMKLAAKCGGNSWHFVSEMQKIQAGGLWDATTVSEVSVFDVVDSFLYQYPARWSRLDAFGEPGSVLSVGVSQARSLSGVQSGNTSGVHPYVVQKLQRMMSVPSGERFSRFAGAIIRSRNGSCSDEEALEIFC